MQRVGQQQFGGAELRYVHQLAHYVAGMMMGLLRRFPGLVIDEIKCVHKPERRVELLGAYFLSPRAQAEIKR